MAEAPLGRDLRAVSSTPTAPGSAWRGLVSAGVDGLGRAVAFRRATGVGVPGSVQGGVRWTLRLEGGAVLAVAVLAYAQTGAGWLPFALMFFLPDLALLGYLGGPRVGATLYNAAHSSLVPLGLIGLGTLGGEPVALAIGLTWLAHVGFDRLCGFGLKYASGFSSTHLGPIGRPDPW